MLKEKLLFILEKKKTKYTTKYAQCEKTRRSQQVKEKKRKNIFKNHISQ